MEQDYNGQYEVLVGIDGCRDTLNAYLDWKDFTGDKKVKAYMMEENVGTYVTSNTLVTLTNNLYPYILRFDSDDVMMPHMVSDFNLLKGESVITEFPAIEINGNKRKLTKIMHGCVGYSKELFIKNGGYKNWRCAADTDFLMRATNIGAERKMNKRATFYRRVHRGSLTKQKETGFGSKLRREYKKRLGHPKKSNNFVTTSYTEIS
jgi:hypothetical protein